jgi:hypothetical protein
VRRKPSKQQTPWERIGMSRATWYRHGKPDNPIERNSDAVMAAGSGVSLRTYQREKRALRSRDHELANLVATGSMKPGTADRLLSDPEAKRRILAALRKAAKK